MAKPNKTIAAARRKVPFFTPEEEEANRNRRLDRSRRDNPEQWDIMDAVSEGRMTPAEGAKALEELLNGTTSRPSGP
jgi:hypothetical protein